MNIAIVDYGLGNLFSVRHACARVGITAEVTRDRDSILAAGGLILPGVGAFEDAMASLRERQLVRVLHEFALSGRPMLGICLGMQLLLSESFEFGRHAGLDLIPGQVIRLPGQRPDGKPVKVPKVGWSRVQPVIPPTRSDTVLPASPFERVTAGEYMYFVHSYQCVPRDPSAVVATSDHGGNEFVCAIQHGSVFGCQFHPEKSGPAGLEVYRGFAGILSRRRCCSRAA